MRIQQGKSFYGELTSQQPKPSRGFPAVGPSLEDCDDLSNGLSVQSTAADLRDTAGAERLQ